MMATKLNTNVWANPCIIFQRKVNGISEMQFLFQVAQG